MISFSAPPIFIFRARAGFAANKEKGREVKTSFLSAKALCVRRTHRSKNFVGQRRRRGKKSLCVLHTTAEYLELTQRDIKKKIGCPKSLQ